MSRRGSGNYDKVLRENLVRPSDGLLTYLFPLEVINVTPLPPRVRQTIVEKETGTLVVLKLKGRKSFILHIEFQSTNDRRMVRRMAAYDYMLSLTYNMEVVSIVIYIGEKKMAMKNTISSNGNNYGYELIDIRDIDPKLFLESNNAREIILAILAGRNNNDKNVIIDKILIKLHRLLRRSNSELLERIKELEIISRLRGDTTQNLIIKSLQKMPIIYDVRKDLRFKQGKAEAVGERNTAFVKYLLQHTSHSIEEIARLVNVSKKFVLSVQKAMLNS